MIDKLKTYLDNSKKYFISGLIGTAMLSGVNYFVAADYYTTKVFAVEGLLFFTSITYSTYMADFVIDKHYIKEEDEEEE